eukprot:8611400-Pyramimonas_sp.AAC.1
MRRPSSEVRSLSEKDPFCGEPGARADDVASGDMARIRWCGSWSSSSSSSSASQVSKESHS